MLIELGDIFEIMYFVAAFLLTVINTVTSFNIDTTHTVKTFQPPNHGRDLHFGYTLSFLNRRTIIVGAPSKDNAQSGEVYSCDIKTQKCWPFQEPVVEKLSPVVSTFRCFAPPYTVRCGGVTNAAVRWYYDVVKDACAPYNPPCGRSDIKNENIFSSKKRYYLYI